MAAPTKGLFINNEYTDARDRPTIVVRNPADGSPVGRVLAANADEARAAMDAAADAQPAWEAIGGLARARILRTAAEVLRGKSEELARLITREMGKVLFESRSEVDGAIDNLVYYSDYARTLAGESASLLPVGESLRLEWTARGVVVAITPWNFPAATVTRKIAPALVGGNTMVVKPSSNTPLSTLFIADALKAAGLPKGVLNVVTGPGAEVGKALIQHPTCSTVTLTGSTDSGKKVLEQAATRVAKCLLELGGKAPVIVWHDADLDWAARATFWARYWNAGQACIAAERCFVQERVADRFERKLESLVRSLRVGPGLERGVDMGPLYSVPGRDKVATNVREAEAQGAKVALGGKSPSDGALAKGAFYLPTLLTDVDDDNVASREEIFGPVLPLLTFDDFDDALRRANASRYGLSSYVFTENASLAEKAARELKYGETYINRVGPESPQGYHTAFRESGLGGEGTRYGVQDYLQLKSVYVDWKAPHRPPDYFLPYGDRER
jgi:acyl-CoA reductase-like NAD-dependent aldehyde dehydrogenase